MACQASLVLVTKSIAEESQGRHFLCIAGSLAWWVGNENTESLMLIMLQKLEKLLIPNIFANSK